MIEIARRLVGSRIGDARQAYALIRCPAQVVAPSMADCAPGEGGENVIRRVSRGEKDLFNSFI